MHILDQPLIAVILGILSGLLLVFTLFAISQKSKDAIPEKRMALAYMGLMASTLLGLGLIYLYYLFSGPGFIWYGITTLLAFMVSLLVYAFQNIGNTKGKS